MFDVPPPAATNLNKPQVPGKLNDVGELLGAPVVVGLVVEEFVLPADVLTEDVEVFADEGEGSAAGVGAVSGFAAPKPSTTPFVPELAGNFSVADAISLVAETS